MTTAIEVLPHDAQQHNPSATPLHWARTRADDAPPKVTGTLGWGLDLIGPAHRSRRPGPHRRLRLPRRPHRPPPPHVRQDDRAHRPHGEPRTLEQHVRATRRRAAALAHRRRVAPARRAGHAHGPHADPPGTGRRRHAPQWWPRLPVRCRRPPGGRQGTNPPEPLRRQHRSARRTDQSRHLAAEPRRPPPAAPQHQDLPGRPVSGTLLAQPEPAVRRPRSRDRGQRLKPTGHGARERLHQHQPATHRSPRRRPVHPVHAPRNLQPPQRPADRCRPLRPDHQPLPELHQG